MKTQKALLLAATLSLFGAASAQGDLVAQYGFEEGSGTTVTDAAGGDDNGTITAGPTYVSPGIVGNHALSFSGAGNVNLGANQDLLRAAPGVTLAAWIRPESLTTSGANSIIGISGSTNNGQARAVLQIQSLTVEGVTTHNLLRLGGRQLNGDGFQSLTAPTDTVLNVGETYHVAGTADYATDTITLYINGVQVAQGVVDWADTPALAEDATHLGAFIGAQSNGTGELFEGLIDDARIYNEVLSPTAIAALVPEPGSFGLIAAGALGLLARRRRRNA